MDPLGERGRNAGTQKEEAVKAHTVTRARRVAAVRTPGIMKTCLLLLVRHATGSTLTGRRRNTGVVSPSPKDSVFFDQEKRFILELFRP